MAAPVAAMLAAHEAAIEADCVPLYLRPYCHAADDGYCTWHDCPQIRDGEPARSLRTCPLLPSPPEPPRLEYSHDR